MIRVGTAGWQIPAAVRDRFADGGSSLQRYAGRLRMVEINSTFYSPHRPATFERWAQATPAEFRFAVKLPRAITHDARLVDVDASMAKFLAETAHLEAKRGPVLIQLPPSLAFDADTSGRFFADLRNRFDGEVACEPRHPSWFDEAAEALLVRMRIARVAADPARVPAAATPGGWDGFRYWRLHGSPKVYWSPYGEARIAHLAAVVADPAWVVFDNTASGAATADALALTAAIDASPAAASPVS